MPLRSSLAQALAALPRPDIFAESWFSRFVTDDWRLVCELRRCCDLGGEVGWVFIEKV
ncbi:hypothetical protein Syun_015920 [Stephania yunnanensis]|uniref:Uncharacterized protein n=1 Tax=Stephania yunnanensis TaxID=152371 RepID=A0AAP0J470_9MAGN